MSDSDAITWNAPNGDHPARAASQRSYAAVAAGDLDRWLEVYAEDAVIEDPVGPSMFDPDGRGHYGHDGIRAFWEKAIAPIESFRRSEEHTSELQSRQYLVCRLLLEKKNKPLFQYARHI